MNYSLCFALLTIEILVCSGCKEREEQTTGTGCEIPASQAEVIAVRVANQNVPADWKFEVWKFEVEDIQREEEGWFVYLIDVNNLDVLGNHCTVLVRDDGSTVIYAGR